MSSSLGQVEWSQNPTFRQGITATTLNAQAASFPDQYEDRHRQYAELLRQQQQNYMNYRPGAILVNGGSMEGYSSFQERIDSSKVYSGTPGSVKPKELLEHLERVTGDHVSLRVQRFLK